MTSKVTNGSIFILVPYSVLQSRDKSSISRLRSVMGLTRRLKHDWIRQHKHMQYPSWSDVSKAPVTLKCCEIEM